MIRSLSGFRNAGPSSATACRGLERDRSSRRLPPVLRIVLLTLGLNATACGASALTLQARTVDLLARTANHALPALVQVYEDEGNAAIEHAADAPSAQRAMDAVTARWHGVWGDCGQSARPG